MSHREAGIKRDCLFVQLSLLPGRAAEVVLHEVRDVGLAVHGQEVAQSRPRRGGLLPALAGEPPALYGLVIDHQEQIWFVDVGANMLVRYAPRQQTLTFFQLSLPESAPFGLTLDPAGKLWFTAGGSSANYVGEMAP